MKQKQKELFNLENGDSVRCLVNSKGRLEEMGVWKNGMYNGIFQKFFSEEEKVESEGIMLKNKRNGAWKYFALDGKLLEVRQMYDDSLLFNLDVKDFQFDTITAHNIQILCPQKWVRVVDTVQPVFITIKKDCADDFCPNITVVRVKSKFDLEPTVDHHLQLLREQKQNVNIISRQSTQINSKSAVVCHYVFTYSGLRLGALTGWIMSGDTLMIVTAMALDTEKVNFLRSKRVFEEIIFSMVVE